MAQTNKEIKVAANGGLYIARLEDEPTIPTNADDPIDPILKELGYASEDGATFNKSEEVEEVFVWQSLNAVRKIVTKRDYTANVALAQWNRETVALALGGGEWSEPEPDTYRFDPPADYDPVTDWVAVLETIDGDRVDRWIFERANITGDIEVQAVRSAPMLLPVTLSALTPDGADRPVHYISNDPAYEPAGS